MTIPTKVCIDIFTLGLKVVVMDKEIEEILRTLVLIHAELHEIKEYLKKR